MTNREPVLTPVRIADLRPTQMTVGLREIAEKRRRWRDHDADGRAAFLAAHMVPTLLGPRRRHYVIDHHHLCRALLEEGVASVLVTVVADLHDLDRDAFWTVCDHRSWVHPYDADGIRVGFRSIPKAMIDLADDPYRSLAGALRRAGGFAKDTTPFSEFLWADFLRRRVKAKRIAGDFPAALAQALGPRQGAGGRLPPRMVRAGGPLNGQPAATGSLGRGTFRTRSRRRRGPARKTPRRRAMLPSSTPYRMDGPRMHKRRLALSAALALATAAAHAQDRGSLNPKPLPPLENPDAPSTPAKALFGRVTTPAAGPAHAYGSYAKGCFSGGAALPMDGATWQVMRLSRNRNWGTPYLVDFLERLAAQAPQAGWPGLLVGDMSQPRGGPMITGHASHQLGLDADIWLTPMPDRRMSRAEREETSATDMVRPDRLDIDPEVWTPGQLGLIRLTAGQPEVARLFVNPAIKKALCREAGGDRGWLRKVRPMYGHNYHYHIRLSCPDGQDSCGDQAPPPAGDGCGEELAYWFSDAILHPKPPKVKPTARPPMTMAALPAECRAVLRAR